MDEFDYLVDWVKELCDETEKNQFESALEDEFKPGIWFHIYRGIREVVRDSNSVNDRYADFLDRCKENPALTSKLLPTHTDAGLYHNLVAVVGTKYPDFPFPSKPENPYEDQPSHKVEKKSKKPQPSNGPTPLRNPLREAAGDLIDRFVKED